MFFRVDLLFCWRLGVQAMMLDRAIDHRSAERFAQFDARREPDSELVLPGLGTLPLINMEPFDVRRVPSKGKRSSRTPPKLFRVRSWEGRS